MRWHAPTIVVAVLLALAPDAVRAVAAAKPTVEELRLAALVESTARLGAVDTNDHDDAIPAAAGVEHVRWLERFEAWTSARLEQAPGDADAAALRSDLRARLTVAGVINRDEAIFGDLSFLDVTRIDDAIAVEIRISMGLTEDTAYLLYRPAGRTFETALRFTSLDTLRLFPGDRPAGAAVRVAWMGDTITELQHLVSRGSDGASFLVFAYSPRQPASVWYALRWAVYRLDGMPALVGSGDDTMLLTEAGASFDLHPAEGGFGLDYTTNQGIDTTYWARDVRRRFRVSKWSVEAVGSGATEELGFISEWAHAPAARALRWTNTDALPRFGAARRALADGYTEFGRKWVDVCPWSTRRLVVEVRIDEPGGDPYEPTMSSLFFSVERVGSDFRMGAITPVVPSDPAFIDLEKCPDVVPKPAPDASAPSPDVADVPEGADATP